MNFSAVPYDPVDHIMESSYAKKWFYDGMSLGSQSSRSARDPFCRRAENCLTLPPHPPGENRHAYHSLSQGRSLVLFLIFWVDTFACDVPLLSFVAHHEIIKSAFMALVRPWVPSNVAPSCPRSVSQKVPIENDALVSLLGVPVKRHSLLWVECHNIHVLSFILKGCLEPKECLSLLFNGRDHELIDLDCVQCSVE